MLRAFSEPYLYTKNSVGDFIENKLSTLHRGIELGFGTATLEPMRRSISAVLDNILIMALMLTLEPLRKTLNVEVLLAGQQ